MKQKFYDKTRRDFIRISSLSTFALEPIVSALARSLKIDKINFEKYFFDDEFHYFGNNLTNIHFYFINAKITGKQLTQIANTTEAFMIVKIPQQHVSEEVIREKKFNEEYSNTTERIRSKISGFSFLAFKLFSTEKTIESKDKETTIDARKRKYFVDLSNINNLLDWNNSTLYELLIPSKDDYRSFTQPNWIKFRDANERSINDNENNPHKNYIYNLYKTICDQVFNSKKEFYPLTVLEIPEGLLVTPYSQDRETIFADTQTIQKARFIFSSPKGNVIRTVEQIWTAKLFFDTVEGRKSPALRAVGYIPRIDKKTLRSSGECSDETSTYLPTLLDKNEIVYLTSLGRGNNIGTDWNIETRGLTMTGLGAIAKFHYKNLNPPNGSDLAEYEHHFTLGRDEYIKLARIGVISTTGQKALHVKIAKRKIKNGISYMESKEYIEIIQKEILYFDKNLFVEEEPNENEPYNYIQARKFPSSLMQEGIIHSYDDIYDGDTNTNDDNDVWIDKAIWKQNILPEKWNTHYKRWPFVKISCIKSVTPPIITTKKDVLPDTIIDCGECSPENPLAFWPILETDKTDVYLQFKGLDWNNKEIYFSSTFLFIRKSLIETALNDNCTKAIYDNFFSKDRVERRLIRFVDSEIAYTPDILSKSTVAGNSEELPNKSNVAKTDFIEYYFTLCKESTGRTLKYENKKISPSSEPPIPSESVFNERLFPLFPQVKRSQLYIENIQSFSQQQLPSIIEYNEDYINYGFERKKTVINKSTNTESEIIYNKGKLIFNHTSDFVKNESKILDYKNGIWEERQVEGYKRIKEAFSNAGNSIGSLVNPDFDIQSIGLVKQSIALGRDINRKYEQLTNFADKIDKFNPSDVLRQAPELFNGINLIDILQEVFPEYEAPINEIKNVASRIDTTRNELLYNTIYQEIKNDLQYINNKILTLQEEIQDNQQYINVVKNRINKKKDEFNRNQKYRVFELEKLITSYVFKFKASFVSEINSAANIADAQLEDILPYLATELISKTEAIYPYYQILVDFKGIKDATGKTIKEGIFDKIKSKAPGLIGIIDAYINDYLKDKQYILIDISKQRSSEILNDYQNILAGIRALIYNSHSTYLKYSNAIKDEIKSFDNYQNSSQIDQHANYLNYLSKKLATSDAYKDYSKEENSLKYKKENIQNLINILKKDYPTEFEKIKTYEQEIIRIQTALSYLNDILETINIPHYIDTFNKSLQDIKTYEAKINSDVLQLANRELKLNETKFKTRIVDSQKQLEAFYKNNYNSYKNDLDQLAYKSQNYITVYTRSLGDESLDIIFTAVGEVLTDFEKTRQEIIQTEENLKNELDKQIRLVKTYESTVKNQITQTGKDILVLIGEKIRQKEIELLNNPSSQELINAVLKGKELLNILSTPIRKEINYTWHTSSFKSADFGIVSFLVSNNPKTSLLVNVKNTIYFQPNKFPELVQKITSKAENRVNNFSISLLKAIIINFNEVSYISETNRSPKFEVKIRDVQFAGAFSFVQALESIFAKLLGDNFSVRLTPQNVEIEYLLPIAYLGAPSFGFKDILFKIVYKLHFNKKPMELGIGIGTAENRTKISVGIYTGLFYFIVIGNPKQGITTIEVSIEFGGYFGLTLGPLRGEVKLVVGLYYRKDLSGVIIEGYFLCEGRVKLWFIMITARFYMGVRSQGGYVEGRCTVSYEIRLGRFFKKSFSATYYKKVAGASPSNSQSGSMQKALSLYKAGNSLAVADVNFKSLTQSQQLEKVINPVTRRVKPVTVKEWHSFINSYID